MDGDSASVTISGVISSEDELSDDEPEELGGFTVVMGKLLLACAKAGVDTPQALKSAKIAAIAIKYRGERKYCNRTDLSGSNGSQRARLEG